MNRARVLRGDVQFANNLRIQLQGRPQTECSYRGAGLGPDPDSGFLSTGLEGIHPQETLVLPGCPLGAPWALAALKCSFLISRMVGVPSESSLGFRSNACLFCLHAEEWHLASSHLPPSSASCPPATRESPQGHALGRTVPSWTCCGAPFSLFPSTILSRPRPLPTCIEAHLVGAGIGLHCDSSPYYMGTHR